MQNISDPRKYTEAYPESNIVINQALQVLDQQLTPVDFNQTINTFLKNKNDALLNVAINLAPSVKVSHLIWQSLNDVINNVDEDEKANIFAIPLILVAGSKVKAKLKGSLDVDKLNKFFIENEIFASGSDSFTSAKLIDTQTLAQIKPSQIYYWVRNLHNAKLGLPINIEGSPIEVINEGVFLRFLTGVVIEKPKQNNLRLDMFNKHAMALMRFINDELKTEGVTLFPIPFAPTNLSTAFAQGNDYRKEVAIQVAVSNIVRKLKEMSLTPYALITTENEALKLIVSSKEQSELSEVSLWQFNRFDSFDKALANITNLLHDLQVEWNYARSNPAN